MLLTSSPKKIMAIFKTEKKTPTHILLKILHNT